MDSIPFEGKYRSSLVDGKKLERKTETEKKREREKWKEQVGHS